MKNYLLYRVVFVFCSLLFSFQALAQTTPVSKCQAVDSDFHSKETKEIQKIIDLSSDDIKQYKIIFYNIDKERIDKAKKRLKKVDNKILYGHALAQIYLSKTYKTSPEELSEWLKNYADLPQKKSIQNLLFQKENKGLKKQKSPFFGAYRWPEKDFQQISSKNKIFLKQQIKKFASALKKGKTKVARIVLENKDVKKHLPPQYYAKMALILAPNYLIDNQNKLCAYWAQIAINRMPKDSTAYWLSGLANWRLENYKTAAAKFSHISKISSDPWMISAGDYWSGRCYEKLGQKKQAQKMYAQAAQQKYTFYGILGAQQTNQTLQYQWQALSCHSSEASQFKKLLQNANIQRAMALMLCQQQKLAGMEISAIQPDLSPQETENLMLLAYKYRSYAIALKLAKELDKNNKASHYDYFSYPQPQWEPQDGWTLDSSLVWAIVRQESAFQTKAKSPAGARGLLQLLPNTAFHVTGNKAIKTNPFPLFAPEYNLKLGQEYVSYLLQKSFINGNIFYMLSAYNAGPTNLVRWQKKVKDNNDPLLYIEIIPARETRLYIERVMANYWVYQMQNQQPSKTLEQVAKGQWPTI